MSVLSSKQQSAHGVLLRVFDDGVLLTGESGIGKSELALTLIARGHALIADDAPLFARTADNQLHGHCAPAIQDLLEVRDLGIVNVRERFGDNAVQIRHPLTLIIHLDRDTAPLTQARGTRRNGEQALLGVSIPTLTLTATPGRNLPLLVEMAVQTLK